MKTKDFIKMLQQEDPSGEGYIRLDGDIPFCAVAKEGYWDGAYQYIDEDGNWVVSTRNYKVDIYTTSPFDFIEQHYDESKTSEDNWNFIINKVKFDYAGYATDIASQKVDRVIERFRKSFDDYCEVIDMVNKNKK